MYASPLRVGGPVMWSKPVKEARRRSATLSSYTPSAHRQHAHVLQSGRSEERAEAGTRRPGPRAPGARAPQVAELGRQLLAHGRQERADGVALAHGRVPPVARAVPVRVRNLQRLVPQQLRAERNCLHTISMLGELRSSATARRARLTSHISMLRGASPRDVSAVGRYELTFLFAQLQGITSCRKLFFSLETYLVTSAAIHQVRDTLRALAYA